MNETDSLEKGIGLPDWKLAICLGASWLCIALILVRGIRSSGKAAYFLALFPYVIIGVLLVRAVTLPGSAEGILYFLTPQWDQLLNLNVKNRNISRQFNDRF